ncbi:MAG: hypothetical protein IKE10_01095 [Bacilli bacterium]|nr:hypothetical protein [Bacilli bacterium]
MTWCKYCIDRGSCITTCYKCIISGKEEDVPYTYDKYYCYDEIRAYANCPLVKEYGWYIVNAVSNILTIDKNASFYTSLMSLKDVFDKNENYNRFMSAYNATGPVIAEKLMDSDDNYLRAMMIYPRLEKIADLVNSGKKDLASKRYVMLTLRLVSEYGLQEMYRTARDTSKKGDNKKILKPLDL